MRNKFSAMLIALLAFWAIGCGSSTDFNQISGQQQGPGLVPPGQDFAFLRLAHLSPDAPSVDILVNEVQVGTNVPFEAFTNYLEVPAGEGVRIQVRPTGSSVDVLDASPVFSVGSHNTVAAIGLVAGETNNQDLALQAAVLLDNVNSVSGNELIRLFHTVPGVGPVVLTSDDGTVLAGPVSFGQASSYLSVPEEVETESLQLRTPGPDGQFLAAYTDLRGSDVSLGEALSEVAEGSPTGANFTLVAAGDGSSSLPLIAAVDQANAGGVTFVADPAATAQLRLAHLVPAGPNVEVLINGGLVAEDFSYESVSNYRLVFAGETEIRVRVSGSDEDQEDLFQGTVTVPADQNLTASVILDPQNREAVTVQLLVDDVVSQTETLKLRFYHASPEAPPVRLAFVGETLNNGEPVFLTDEVIAYGNATDYVIIDESTDLDGAEEIVAFDSENQPLVQFRLVRGTGDDLLEVLTALLEAQGEQLNVTVIAAGPTEEHPFLTALTTVDEALAGGATVISDGEPVLE